MFRPILISTISLLGCTALFGQTTNQLAPGPPGLDVHWPSAAKNGFGTSNTLASKVWFTPNNGVMTAINLQIGHNAETPAVVADRYAKRPGNK